MAAECGGELKCGVEGKTTCMVRFEDINYQLCPGATRSSLAELVDDFDLSHVQAGAEIEIAEDGMKYEVVDVHYTANYLVDTILGTTRFNPACKFTRPSRIAKAAEKLGLTQDEQFALQLAAKNSGKLNEKKDYE